MNYEHLDPFDGFLCECGDFATTREISTFGNSQTDLCDKCVLVAFNLLTESR